MIKTNSLPHLDHQARCKPGGKRHSRVLAFACSRAFAAVFLLALPVATMPTSAWAAGKAECSNLGQFLSDQTLQFGLTHSQVPGQLAVSQHSLRIAGKQYKLEANSTAKGLLALMFPGQMLQKSEGMVDKRLGLKPLYYAEKRGKKPLAEVVVQEASSEVLFRKNSNKAPYEKRLQDRLSLPYQLSALLRCGWQPRPADRETWPVMSTGRVVAEVLHVVGEEELTLALETGTQTLTALRIETRPEHKDDDTLHLWFAKSLDWLPVRIQLQDPEGKTLTQSLIKLPN